MNQFINNRVTTVYSMAYDTVLRYTTDEAMEMIKGEVARRLGKYAFDKCTLSIQDNPTTLDKEYIHHCYIFSEKDLYTLAKRIQELESENRYLQFELNRRQAGHFDNI